MWYSVPRRASFTFRPWLLPRRRRRHVRCFTLSSPAGTPLALGWLAFRFGAIENSLPNIGGHFAPRPLARLWIGFLAHGDLLTRAVTPGGVPAYNAAIAAAMRPAFWRDRTAASRSAAYDDWLDILALLGGFLVQARHAWRALCDGHFARCWLFAVSAWWCQPRRATHSAAVPGHIVHPASESGDAI